MMKSRNHFLNKSILAGYFVLLTTLFLLNPASGFTENFQKENTFARTTQARLAVEQAWETYHDGALGGTLSSPAAQIQLEMNLHKSRALLAEAYEAEDKGDMKTVDKLIHEIMQITKRVITESLEPKK
ncbi:MAG: hypothetical protein ACI8PD_000776 [Nitrospinales bacterium]|jgi:hypothetical protein